MNKDQLAEIAKAMVTGGKGILAADESSGQNLLVDYLGDVRRSAQLKLPVFRLVGVREPGSRRSISDAKVLIAGPPVAVLRNSTVASLPPRRARSSSSCQSVLAHL